MTNPLIRPNDPRFQRLPIDDAAGKNRFGDDRQLAENGDAEQASASAYATTSSASQQPYQPKYEASAPSRGKLLMGLALVGLAGMLLGVLGAAGLVDSGWVFPACGAVAGGTAMFLGYSDLREMSLGARDAAGRSATGTAMWLGLLGLVGCAALVAVMIWMELSVFPNL